MSTTHSEPAAGVPAARSALPVPAPRPVRDAARPAAAAGIAFSVALFIAVASLEIPRGASDSEMQKFWQDDANRSAMIGSTAALAAGGLLFLGFLTYLTRRLLAGRSEEEAGLAPRLAQNAGLAFVAMMFATGLTGAIARGLVVDDEPVPGSDLLRYFAQIRYTAMGAFAMPAVALVIACTAYVVLRDRVLPRWLGILSVGCVVIIAGACALFVGQLAIPVVMIWVVSCSVVFLRHRG
jgi:hypothetical protein